MLYVEYLVVCLVLCVKLVVSPVFLVLDLVVPGREG